MIRAVLLSTAAVLMTAVPAMAQDEAAARRILERTPLIDGHNDLPWALRQQHGNDPHAVDLTVNLDASTALHTDIPRLRAGGVGGQFWSVYVPASLTPVEAAKATFEQIDTVKRIVAALMANGWSAADIRKLAGENVLRVMRAVEAVVESQSEARPSLAKLPEDGAPE